MSAFRTPEHYRRPDLERAIGRSPPPDLVGGVFVVPAGPRRVLVCLASNGGAWEHVSVSLRQAGRALRATSALPSWADMCLVRDLFWSSDVWVVQFHPNATEYVDNAPVLHLWRPMVDELPTPPSILTGVRT